MAKKTVTLDLSDIQGLIHHGYHLPFSRHLLFEIQDRHSGRRFLRFLAPQVTNAAAANDIRAQRALNVGVTFRGLLAIGVPDELLIEFPTDFKNLPYSNEEGDSTLGDFGPSAPQNWWNKNFGTAQVHLIVHTYSQSVRDLENMTDKIRNAADDARVVELIPTQDRQPIECRPLEGGKGKIHFGYRDGISQPRVNWDENRASSNGVDFRHFLLGYSNDDIPSSPFRGAAAKFARNGSYEVFRWLYQDVARFSKFLEDDGPGASPLLIPAQAQERLAAKLVGRWRDGTPLVLSPDGPDDALSASNSFSYADDPLGEKCPFQAHIRVANPRDQELGFAEQLDGGVPRVIRRGAPYGNKLEGTIDDGQQRGLVGIFLCASITRQVFKLLVWMNATNFSPVFKNNHAQDVFGNREFPDADQAFSFTAQGATRKVNLLDFVRTDGTAFFLLPSRTTLGRLSE